MYEAAFGLAHESHYAELTRGIDARVQMWCNNHCDLLHVTGEDAQAVVDGVGADVGMADVVEVDDEMILVTNDCLLKHEENLLEVYLERHGCLSFPPRTYEDGKITARVIALTETALADIYEDLSGEYDVTVEAKREIRTITPDVPILVTNDVFPDLSERQAEAIATAHAAGYYEIPRDCSTADIAAEMGVERRTAEEHLRIAERKIVDGYMDHLASGPTSLR